MYCMYKTIIIFYQEQLMILVVYLEHNSKEHELLKWHSAQEIQNKLSAI